MTAVDARSIDVAAKMDKMNDILFVANYMGLVNGQRGEQVMVTHDVLNATHMAYGELETSMQYLTGKPLGQTLTVAASHRQLMMLEDYKRKAEEHLHNLNEEMAKLSRTIEDRIVGTAVSHATSGSLDTIMDVAVKV